MMDNTELDDPPTMPSLDLALARIAAENPQAAAIAQALLDGHGDARTEQIRTRVSPRELVQVKARAEAEGTDMSNLIRRLLGLPK